MIIAQIIEAKRTQHFLRNDLKLGGHFITKPTFFLFIYEFIEPTSSPPSILPVYINSPFINFQ